MKNSRYSSDEEIRQTRLRSSESMICTNFCCITHSFMCSLLAAFCDQIQVLSFCLCWNPMWGPLSMQPSGMSLPVLSTSQLRDMHNENVFKAATRRWLLCLLVCHPLSWCSCFFRARKLTISHCLFLCHTVCFGRKTLWTSRCRGMSTGSSWASHSRGWHSCTCVSVWVW